MVSATGHGIRVPDRSAHERGLLGWMRGGGDVERRLREDAWQLEQRIVRLEREREDLRRILAGLGEGVLAVDATGIVLHANPVAIELLDMDESSCLGSHLFVAVQNQSINDAIEDVMRGDDIAPADEVQREFVVELDDGVERTLLVVVTPLRTPGRVYGPASVPEGAIAVVRDVTELRRLERARQDFFTNVSPELKTPLTAIRGALETVATDADMPTAIRDRFLASARQHAARLGALVTDLLSLARLERDPATLPREPVDLVGLVDEVLDAATGLAEAGGVRLVRDSEGEDVAAIIVECDEESMRQAVTNLVDNAIAHSAEAMTVRVGIEHDGVIAEIAVHDEGVGIPADAIERVFERFYRVDAARSRARGGTGIGLSIVKHVAQAHGGTVELTSALDVGSTFRLRLPVSRTARPGTADGG